MDVCPVGAITTKDYRFKSRPWDNPEAVDTICTLCEKGCNTTAWIKAKPEWAKGAQLIRTTPAIQSGGERLLDVRHRPVRLSLDRRRRAAAASAAAQREPARSSRPTGRNALAKVADRVKAAGNGNLRFLISAHASLEELFLIGKLGGALSIPEDGVAISWRTRVKPQPPRREVQDSAGRCAERQRREGSRLPGPRRCGRRRRPRRRSARRSSRQGVAALYVFDPGPDGSIGDVSWVIEASEVRQAAAADRPRRADDRAREGGRHRAAGHRVGREGRRLRQHRRTAAGRVARDRRARRGAGRLAGLRQRRRWRSACR